MMHGADAAEQMVRLSLEGAEMAMRISGAGAKKSCGTFDSGFTGRAENTGENAP